MDGVRRDWSEEWMGRDLVVDDDAVVFGRDSAFLGKVVSVLLGE